MRALIAHALDTPISIRANGRASSAEDAHAAILTWTGAHGVTRLAESTWLDRLGLPNWYVIRPSARHPTSIVCSGKGTDAASARLSGLFECYERWAAEHVVAPLARASMSTLRRVLPEWRVAAPAFLSDDAVITWAVGVDLVGGGPCLVPLRKVLFPHDATSPAEAMLSNDTNGLSAGTALIEALALGLLELIERDAIARIAPASLDRVDVGTLSGVASRLAAIFLEHRVDVSLVRCPSPTGIPVVYCMTRDDAIALPVFFCSGSGAHPDPVVAAARALTEAAQSRTGFVSGLREDVSERIDAYRGHSYAARRAELAYWFDAPATLPLASLGGTTASTFNALLAQLVARVRAAFADPVIVCIPLHASDRLAAVRLYSPQLYGYRPEPRGVDG